MTTEEHEEFMQSGASLPTSLSCPTGNGLCADFRKVWKSTMGNHFRAMVRFHMNGDNIRNKMLLRV